MEPGAVIHSCALKWVESYYTWVSVQTEDKLARQVDVHSKSFVVHMQEDTNIFPKYMYILGT